MARPWATQILSNDDHDEMDDLLADNANTKGYHKIETKGCWRKNKSKVDEVIHTKVPVSMDRNMCKTKINNSIEKRTSMIDNVYNCGNDHQCNQNRQEVNSLECKEAKSTYEIMLVCAIDLILEDPGQVC